MKTLKGFIQNGYLSISGCLYRHLATMIIFLSCLITTSFAQVGGRYNNWHFGHLVTMQFPVTGNPIFSNNTAMCAQEGVASISDFNGNLLFYTNGQSVWDSNNILVTNELMGEASSTQAVMIIPRPSHPNRYYIFTTSDWGTGYMYWSEVNVTGTSVSMVLPINNKVIYPNQNSVSEKLTATCSNNNTDIWVIAHENNSNAFIFLKVTATGPSFDHLQNIGTTPYDVWNCVGQMKVSPDGKKLALANAGARKAELYDFDNTIGLLSNMRDNYTTGLAYGIEFSPNSQLLYLSMANFTEKLKQYTILPNSLVLNYTFSTQDGNLNSLQLGPDGKIYGIAGFDATNINYLDVINNPDVVGVNCNFNHPGIPIVSIPCGSAGHETVGGLPNNVWVWCEAGTTGRICGMKFNDLNGNGIMDTGEPGLPNWTIKLTSTSSTTVATVTDANGNYCFNNLSAGTYTITESNQGEWIQTLPIFPGTYTVILAAGQNIGSIDFGNKLCNNTIPTNIQQGLIAYYPFNGGSVNDFSGNTHHLTNMNANPSTDRYGNANCAFEFDNIPASNNQFLTVTSTAFLNGLNAFSVSLWYQALDASRLPGVYETLLGRDYISGACPDKTGQWTLGLYDCRKAVFGRQNSVWQLPDPACDVLLNTGGWHHLTASYNQVGQTIKIYKDGVLQGTKTGVANCGVAIQDIGDLFIGKNYTGKIDDIFIHSRELGQLDINSFLTLGSSCCSDLPLKLCGTKFNDLNRNGVKDTNETGLPNWTIKLSGSATMTTVTDESGNYCFNNLSAGTYMVAETQQSGWSQTFPASPGNHTVILGAGQDLTNINFGNIQDPCSDGDKSWIPLGSGTNGQVLIIEALGTYLYAGGEFTSAGGVSANHIAKWDGTGWSLLGAGVNGQVLDIVTIGTDLYVAGSFTTAGGIGANNIAKWNGTSWSPLGSGMDATVLSLAVLNGKLYAGGEFISAGGVITNHIALWDGTNWLPLGSGMNGGVPALTAFNGALYAGGVFTTAGGVSANRIAKWDGTNWSPLGSGMNLTVISLKGLDNDLYAAGGFTTAGGVSANQIAKWDGTNWSPLGSGIGSQLECLATMGTDLYTVGQFTTAGGVNANRIAKWNGTNWSSLRNGTNAVTNALEVVGADLYAGGNFTIAGEVNAYHIARWTCMSVPVSVGEVKILQEYQLKQNYPNPFSSTSTIDYYIPQKSFVSIKVYDFFGKEIKVLVDEEKNPGHHSVVFDGGEFGNGIYFYTLKTSGFTQSKKMILMK